MGRLAEAQTSLDRAVSTAENIRTTLPSPEFRARYFATAHKAYDLLIDVLLRQDQVTPERGLRLTAFEVAERARARSLLDLLNESHVDLREGLDADLLARERTLESSLAAKIQYAAGGQGPSKSDAEVALTRREIDALIGALRDVESEIRAKSPRAAALTQPSTATVADVQRDLLDDETALVEYALGDERSFVWTVTRSSVDVRQLPSRGDLEKAVRRAYGDVSVNDLSTNGSLDRSLKELSALLVGPVRSVAVHRVAIVADGALEYLPFAALPGRAGAPLLADYEVVMLPSVSTLAELRRNEAGRTYAPKLIAAIADPVFDAHDVRVVSGQTNGSAAASDATGPRVGTDVRRSAAEAGVSGLDRLPYSRQEVDVIDTLVPSADRLTALDFDANRGLMLGDSLRNYRIVHIATHGLINSQHPELSGLVLSLVDRSGRPQNGFVQSYELYKTKLDADLVVLSACQTALGEEIRGEGLVSLTRPFMYAGVPRVVASLWQVPDRATAELMTRFYTGLVRDHLSASAALRRAQLALRKNPRWSRPYFWAGFTLQGDWR
jgi:CHAT domain-containing protein